MWAREMQIKVHATKPDELSLLPSNTHSGRIAWSLLSIPVISTHVPWRTTPSYTHTHKIHKCTKLGKYLALHSYTAMLTIFGWGVHWFWFDLGFVVASPF